MKRDIYQEITNEIIKQLQSGTVPWVRPWKTIKGEATIPTNCATGRSYRGINVPALWSAGIRNGFSSNLWLSYKQAQSIGANVRKGERGSPIVFVKFSEIEDRNDSTLTKRVPFIRHSTVFNAEQIDGLPAFDTEQCQWDGVENVDNLIADTGAIITHGGDRACYMPGLDRINMPNKAAFTDPSHYYATLLHELTHWTGNKSRLNRLYGSRFGNEDYAREELVAEMGAAFLCAHCGIDGELQHASYIDSWIKVLKSDKRAIVNAASQAQKAADYVTGHQHDQLEVAA
jgi:antirestriction protein ArdC